MTREEEIKKAAANYCEVCEPSLAKCGDYSFTKGAEWSDENPKSHWISVESDLPNNPKYLKQPDDSPWVLAITENGEILFAQMIVMNGRWIWHSHFNWKHEDIRHWMPIIPSLPKEYENIWEMKL